MRPGYSQNVISVVTEDGEFAYQSIDPQTGEPLEVLPDLFPIDDESGFDDWE